MAEILDFTLCGDVKLRFEILPGEIVNERFSSNSVVTGSGSGATVAGYGTSSVKIETTITNEKEFWVKLENGYQERFLVDKNIPLGNGQEVELIKVFAVNSSTAERINVNYSFFLLINKATKLTYYGVKSKDDWITLLEKAGISERLANADYHGLLLAYPTDITKRTTTLYGLLFVSLLCALVIGFFSHSYIFGIAVAVIGILCFSVGAYSHGNHLQQLKANFYRGNLPSQWALKHLEARNNAAS